MAASESEREGEWVSGRGAVGGEKESVPCDRRQSTWEEQGTREIEAKEVEGVASQQSGVTVSAAHAGRAVKTNGCGFVAQGVLGNHLHDSCIGMQ